MFSHLRAPLAFATLAACLLPAAALALPFSEWQTAWFTVAQQADLAISGPLADPDADGMPNLHEYFLLGDPLLYDAPLIAPRLERIDGVLTLSYRENLAAEDTLGWLQASSDLIHWANYGSEAEIARDLGETFSDVAVADYVSADAPRRFVRLQVAAGPLDFGLRPPVAPVLTASTPSHWTILWGDPNLAEAGYAVDRENPFGGAWTRLADLPANYTEWEHTSANPAHGSNYRVVALGYSGEELVSETVALADNDGDGIPDQFELGAAYVGGYGTYPSFPGQYSSSANGVPDGWGPHYGYLGSPGLDDADGDGIDDLTEGRNGLDPYSKDTDGDGRTDAWELANGYDPLVAHSPYLMFHIGSTPLSLAENLRVNLPYGEIWEAGTLHFLPSPPALHSPSGLQLYQQLLRDSANGFLSTYYPMGSTGVLAAAGRDVITHPAWSTEVEQDHSVVAVWPPNNAPPYTIYGTPWYWDSYVGEGFPPSWNSYVHFLAIDLLGRVWVNVNTASDSYQLRAYTAENTFQSHYNVSNGGALTVAVLQSDGVKEIGYVQNFESGLVGAFVGKPAAADLVNFYPLALNRRGDLVAEDEPWGDDPDGPSGDLNLANYYSQLENRVMDADHVGVEILQKQKGARVVRAFVKLADGTRHDLPDDADAITGFDDSANVYGREIDGRPVIWVADPSAWAWLPARLPTQRCPTPSPFCPTAMNR